MKNVDDRLRRVASRCSVVGTSIDRDFIVFASSLLLGGL
jgi:hypothetical protein